MPQITGFHHTAFRTDNFDKVLGFYTDTLGLTVKITWGAAPKRAVMLDAGDGGIVEIFEREGSDIEGTILHFALRTDDCTVLTERVRAAGCEITMEPKDVTIDSNLGPCPVRISFFKGPAGEIVELFESDAV